MSASSPDVTLADLRFRKGARFIYSLRPEHPWRHEVRIEERLEREARKTYPICTGGDGTVRLRIAAARRASWTAATTGCHSRRYTLPDLLSLSPDLDTMVEVLQGIVEKDNSEVLALDQETRWRLEDAVERARAGSKPKVGRSCVVTSTPDCAPASTTSSCTSSGETLGAPLCEQVGRKQCCLVSLPLPMPAINA